jgi:Oxygenase domain of the 2OGFeDO superfamily
MVQPYPKSSNNFSKPAALDWLGAISESNAIFSAILAVIHPTLYDAGWEAVKRLRGTPEIDPQNVFMQWASVFSGVSVISNRYTPPHRDRNSRKNWYDMLVTLGRYRSCQLELPGLGIALEYNPGTVVGISGNILEHAVPSFEGDRVCYAYFMRDNVHEWAKVPASHWMYVDHYK